MHKATPWLARPRGDVGEVGKTRRGYLIQQDQPCRISSSIRILKTAMLPLAKQLLVFTTQGTR